MSVTETLKKYVKMITITKTITKLISHLLKHLDVRASNYLLDIYNALLIEGHFFCLNFIKILYEKHYSKSKPLFR